jgi:cytochrome c oxidase subunit III
VSARVLDVSRYSPYNSGSAATLWWGFIGLITIEIVVFSSLISSYFYLRLVAREWPPAGVAPPDLTISTINTALLIASSVCVHLADQGIRKGNARRLKVGLGVAAVIVLVFLVLKGLEYSKMEYRWDSHAYGAIVWTLTGFHTAHVVTLVLKTLVVETLALRGYFNAERNLGVQVNGLYWHFVVVVWLPIYFVVYYVPRLGN